MTAPLDCQLSASQCFWLPTPLFPSIPNGRRLEAVRVAARPYPFPPPSHTLVCSHSGRYPKRKLTKEWRQLVALLLGIPELVLTEDFVNAKVAVNVSGSGGTGGVRGAYWGLCSPGEGGRECTNVPVQSF